jgi:hypothetical protein
MTFIKIIYYATNHPTNIIYINFFRKREVLLPLNAMLEMYEQVNAEELK